ncbi:MAG: ATP-binding protein [Candidatus Omnitrophota bacterium]
MAFEDSIYSQKSTSRPHNPSAKRRMPYETRLLLLALGAGLPGSAFSLILIWTGGYSLKVELTVTLFVILFWFGFALAAQESIVTTLRTLSNLLAAFHEGDYSLRAIQGSCDDVLREVASEINVLGNVLRQQRLSAVEAASLLRKVMDEIDVAVMAFDEDSKLRLVNQRAQQLLNKPVEALLGRTSDELGAAKTLEGEAPRLIELSMPGAVGRWELRRGEFRLQGKPHRLIVLSDLTRALREEERQAWKRLVQVLRHEINNSLAPIHSLADSLRALMARERRPEDWEEDLRQGLDVIRDRSEGLNRFMASYSRLTKLPKPRFTPVDVAEWAQRAVNLEPHPAVVIDPGPPVLILADKDQLDQALINLIKNAVEAVQEAEGRVRLTWSVLAKPSPHVEIIVEDEGSGILNPENLFVPFFTTKPQGSGLGLMISRQIAEAHNGALTLENRRGRSGCIARLRLPIQR